MWVCGQHHAPAALAPRKRPVTHCIGGWISHKACLDGCGKSRQPPGFDPRSVQPVASRYTDWAIPAPAVLVWTVWKGVPRIFLITMRQWSLRLSTYRYIRDRLCICYVNDWMIWWLNHRLENWLSDSAHWLDGEWRRNWSILQSGQLENVGVDEKKINYYNEVLISDFRRGVNWIVTLPGCYA